MVRRLREEWDEQTNSIVRKWVRGPPTLPKVFNQPRGSRLQLIWDDDNNPVGPDKHPNLFSESIGVLMAKARLYDWRKRWEEQKDQEHLWTKLKKVWDLDEERKEVTLGRIANKEFKNKKCKLKKNHYARHSTYEQRVIDKPQQLTAQEWASCHAPISEPKPDPQGPGRSPETEGRDQVRASARGCPYSSLTILDPDSPCMGTRARSQQAYK
ncbi:hypothetical protein ACHQM5_010168 [Ranunculus cassubicifolius]